MGFPWIISNTSKAFLVVCTLFITACNPALYKKPAENFQTATISLKQAYFIELDLSNKARIERGDLEDQIAIWGAPTAAVVGKSEVQRISQNMEKRRLMDIHEDLKPLREKAFSALVGYAETLVSLASDEPTEAIVSELNGLVQDINGVIKAASKIEAIGEKAEKITSFIGPLQQYVGVLNEVASLVSGVIRERTIVQTIGKSNDSVVELLTVLKTEAVAAHENTQSQIRAALENLESFLKNTNFANASNESKALVAKRVANLKVFEEQIKSYRIENPFDAAIKAQGALVKKAILKDPKDWTIQIRAFRENVAATKEAIEKVKSGM